MPYAPAKCAPIQCSASTAAGPQILAAERQGCRRHKAAPDGHACVNAGREIEQAVDTQDHGALRRFCRAGTNARDVVADRCYDADCLAHDLGLRRQGSYPLHQPTSVLTLCQPPH